MAVFLYANNASTTLAGPIAAGATSINLAAGTGALFPQPATGQQFAMTLISQLDESVFEIVYCISRATDVCTVIRGQEGTPPTAFIANDNVNNFLTAGTMAALIQASQLQTQAGNYGQDTGTVNNLLVALSPQPASLPLLTGAPIRVRIGNTNTGGSTLTLIPLPAASIATTSGNALSAGMLVAGSIAEFVYNGNFFIYVSGNNIFTDPGAAGVTINGQSVNGASLKLIGPGSNPNKYIRCLNGVLQFVNSTFTALMTTIDDVGDLFSAGTITSGGIILSGNKVRASVGASGSGDNNCCTVLGDFFVTESSSGGNSFGWARLPTGVIWQWGNCGQVPIDGAAHSFALNTPFTIGGVVNANLGSNINGIITLGCQLTSVSTFAVTLASTTPGGSNGVWYTAIGV